jgi:hypothetical protein
MLTELGSWTIMKTTPVTDNTTCCTTRTHATTGRDHNRRIGRHCWNLHGCRGSLIRQALQKSHTHRFCVLKTLRGILLHRLDDYLFYRTHPRVPNLHST